MKILVIYTTAGAGHKKAAEAIFNHIKAKTRNDVSFIDALDYTNNFFRFSYSQGYSFLITHFPHLWGFFYWLTNCKFLSILVDFFRGICNFINSRRLSKFILSEKPDVIISTHFFANQIVSSLKHKTKLNSKLICVITDFTIHRFWLARAVDLYTVANKKLEDCLIAKGVEKDKILISGIPVSENFLRLQDRHELRSRFELDDNVFTALIVTGAIGIGPIEGIVTALKDEINLIVVCGRNKKLFNKLSQSETKTLKVFGLVDNIHELMSVSDVIITKAGGLTISESMSKELPMIFFNLIPGQEALNASLMQSLGAGIIAKDISSIKQAVLNLKENRKALLGMRERIKAIAKPDAVYYISELLK